MRRGEIIDRLCANVGIHIRAVSSAPYLTKRELMQINSWVDIAKNELKNLREGDNGDGNRGSTPQEQ